MESKKLKKREKQRQGENRRRIRQESFKGINREH
jgi:hypothetical protein